MSHFYQKLKEDAEIAMSPRMYTYVTNTILAVLLLSTSSVYQPSQAVTHPGTTVSPTLNIIFDLGGVLIDTDNVRALWQLGPVTLLRYFKHKHSNREIINVFYQTLNNITKTEGNPENVCDFAGRQLPQLMVDWLKGAKSCKEIRQLAYHHIKEHPEWFISPQEQQIMLYMCRMCFTPDLFSATRKLIPEGVAFVKECKKRGHRVFVLSNWDTESFSMVCARYPELFSLFDGIIISGDVGVAKPHPAIYEYFTQQFDPATYVLIDDQPENLAAAAAAGIFGIQCVKDTSFWSFNKMFFGPEYDFASIRRQLLKRHAQLVQAGYQ